MKKKNKRKNIFNQFEIEEKIKLDPEEKELVLGIKDSKSIINNELVDSYKKTALNQKKRTKQLSNQ